MKADIFALGCVFFFILANGRHPFGSPVERSARILKNDDDLENFKLEVYWKEIIAKMISGSPDLRPSAKDVLNNKLLKINQCDARQQSLAVALTSDTNKLGPDTKKWENTPNVVSNIPEITQQNLEPRLHIVARLQQRLVQLKVPQVLKGRSIKNVQTGNLNTDHSLHELVYYGADVEIIKDFVTLGADPQKLEAREGNSLLHYAAHGGNYKVVAYIISLGVSANSTNKGGYTPLQKSVMAQNNFMETVRALIYLGADVNHTDSEGYTVFILAVRFQKTEEDLREIVALGGNPKHLITTYESALHIAARVGNFQCIVYLISLGLDLHATGINDSSPIHYAMHTEQSFASTVDELLAHGADLNAVTAKGDNAIFEAVQGKRSANDMNTLIKLGANWKIHNHAKESILHVAAKAGSIELMKYFLEKGADPHCVDRTGVGFTSYIENDTTLEEVFCCLVKNEIEIRVNTPFGKQVERQLRRVGNGEEMTILRKVIKDGQTYQQAKTDT